MTRLPLILLVINLLALPLGCVPAMFLMNSFNPMQLAFVTDFSVENRTGESIWITPIGTVGTQGKRWPIPTSSRRAPWMESSQRARLPIECGAKRTLFYDWDDINFSELVVERAGAEPRQLVVNPDPTTNQYSRLEVNEFVIDDWDALAPLEPDVRAAYDEAQVPLRLWPILIWTALPAVTFLPVLWWYQRSRTPRGSMAPSPPPLPPLSGSLAPSVPT